MNDALQAIIKVLIKPDEKLNSDLQKITNNISKQLTSAFEQVFKVALPAMTVVGLATFTDKFAKEIEKIGNAADRLKMPVDQMDAWVGVAEMAGVSADSLIGTLDHLHREMVSAGRFQGGGLMEEIMRGYAPQVGDIDAVEDYLVRFSTAISKVDKARAYGEMDKIGITDPKMKRLLMEGGDNLRFQLEFARKLGVITEEDRKNADRFNFAARAVQRTFERALLPVFRILAPVMEKISLGILFLRQHWEIAVPFIIALMGKWTIAMIRWGVAFAVAHAPLMVWIAVLTLVGLAIEDVVRWLEGGDSALGRWLGSFDEWAKKHETIVGTFKSLKEGLKTVVSFLKENAGVLAMVGTGIAVGGSLYRYFRKKKKGLGSNLPATIPGVEGASDGFGMLQTVLGGANGVGKAQILAQTVEITAQSVYVEGMNGLLESTQSVFGSMKEWMKNAWDKVGGWATTAGSKLAGLATGAIAGPATMGAIAAGTAYAIGKYKEGELKEKGAEAIMGDPEWDDASESIKKMLKETLKPQNGQSEAALGAGVVSKTETIEGNKTENNMTNYFYSNVPIDERAVPAIGKNFENALAKNGNMRETPYQ